MATERFRALDAIAARAQTAREPAALFSSVGEALQALGLTCYITEWDAETGDAVMRYFSLSPPLQRAAQMVIGRPIDGLRIAAANVPSFAAAIHKGQAIYLHTTEDELHAALPWLPRTAAHYLVRLLSVDHAIVAPLLTSGMVVGVIAVSGAELSEGDTPFVTSLGTYVGEALAAARLMEAARRRQDAALALGELSARVADGVAPEALPALAVRALRTPLGAAAAAVWLLDDTAANGAESLLRLVAEEGIPAASRPAVETVPLSADRITARVAREGRTVALRNLDTTSGMEESRNVLTEAGFGLAITAPLRAGGRVFGAISLTFTEQRPAPADERAFVEAVATQIAAAMENARLLAEARAQAARATLLADLAALFNRSLDSSTLLAALVQKASEALGGGAGVYRVREGRDEFEVAAYYHPDPATLARIMRTIAEIPPRPEVGIFGQAYQEKRPLLIRFDDPTLPEERRVYAERVGATSSIAVPLLAQGRPLGVLTINSIGAERLFNEDDLELATAIGNLAAQSLENARAYAAVEQGRRRLLATFESMVDGVFLYDAHGNVVDLNEAAVHLLGLESREEALRPAAEFPRLMEMRGLGGPIGVDDIASLRAVRGETVIGQEESVRNRATGEERRLIVNAAPIYDDVDGLAGAVLVAHDVTALRAAERVKDEFLSLASHELRTPLTPLKGFIQIMSEMVARATPDAPPDRARLSRYLRLMENRLNRLIQLVGAMLDLTRLQQGSFALDLASADLALLAADVLAGFEAVVEAPHSLILDAPEPVVTLCDAQRIDQVLTNLISNALKYSPTGGTVRVSIGAQGDLAVLIVEDEGIGIPPGEEEGLFQPFTRGSNAPHLQYAGVGLGLYICREIVARHGGQISAAPRDPSGIQPGTVIRVTLPLAGPAALSSDFHQGVS